MRRTIVYTLLLLLLVSGAVTAHEFTQGDQCLVEADETIEGNLFAFCRLLTIDGHGTGNIIGAALNAEINGQVDGDIYLTANQLIVNAQLGEDLHFAGTMLQLDRQTEFVSEKADLFSVTLSTEIMQNVTVPGSVIGAGYQLLINGDIGEQLSYWGSALMLNGAVAGDVDVQVGDATSDAPQLPLPVDVTLIRPGLTIEENASFASEFRYISATSAEIASGVTFAEPPFYTPIIMQPDLSQITLNEDEQTQNLGVYIAQVVREFIALTLIGTISIMIAPHSLRNLQRNLRTRPLPCLAIGLLTFILSALVFAVLIFISLLIFFALFILLQINELTIVGGVGLFVLNLGSISLFYFVAIFVSRAILGLAIGRMIVRVINGGDTSTRGLLLSLVIGTALLSLITAIPYIGTVVNALAAFFGLGTIILRLQNRIALAREGTVHPSHYNINISTPIYSTRQSDDTRLIPPPPPIMYDDTDDSIGMKNLPDGFSWWED